MVDNRHVLIAALLVATPASAADRADSDARTTARITYVECLWDQAKRLDDGAASPDRLAVEIKQRCAAAASDYINTATQGLPDDRRRALAETLGQRTLGEALNEIESHRKSAAATKDFRSCLSHREALWDDGMIDIDVLADRIHSECSLRKLIETDTTPPEFLTAFAKSETREIVEFVRETRKAKSHSAPTG